MSELDWIGNLRLHLLWMTSPNACTVHRLKTFSISTWHQNLKNCPISLVYFNIILCWI